MTFGKKTWPEIAEFMTDMASNHSEFEHMAVIVQSIIESGVADQLAGETSMHDLRVVSSPVQSPPHDPVIVRAPSSLRRPPAGTVVIEHQASTGPLERAERPVADAVPLFWRFVSEKFGVRPIQ